MALNPLAKFWQGITPGAISAATSNIPQESFAGWMNAVPAIGNEPPASTSGGDPNVLRTNPGLAEAEALAGRDRTRLAGDYWGNIQQLLLGYGSQDLARRYVDKIMGSITPYIGNVNTDFINTISDNPDTSFSTLGQLGRSTKQATIDTREGVNNQNLFFSGHGAQAVSDQNYANQKAYASAADDENKSLASASSNYAGGLAQIEWALWNAAQGAYGNELGSAYKYPTTPSPETPQVNSYAPSSSENTVSPLLSGKFFPGSSADRSSNPAQFWAQLSKASVTPAGKGVGIPHPYVYPVKKAKAGGTNFLSYAAKGI